MSRKIPLIDSLPSKTKGNYMVKKRNRLLASKII